MIKFITNSDDYGKIYKEQAYQNKQVNYIPKFVHCGISTIEDYLSWGKVDFSFEAIADIYSLLKLPPPNTRLLDLTDEQQLLVHYFSYLLISSSHTFIEFPDNGVSADFLVSFKLLISYYNFGDITLLTCDKEIINSISNIEKLSPCQHTTFDFKLSKRDIISTFLGGQILIFTSLVIAVILILLIALLNNHLANQLSSYPQIPTNIIVINNESNSCEFNSKMYDLNISNCTNVSPISYGQLSSLVNWQGVEHIAFDDKYNSWKIDEQIINGQAISVSIPDLGFNLSNILPALPCVNPQTTPSNVSCGQYQPTTSLIAIANSKDVSQIEKNIDFDGTSAPNYILIQATNSKEIAFKLASSYPSIGIYTSNLATEYLNYKNSQLFILILAVGSSISLGYIFILNLLLSQLKLTIRSQKYALSYLLKDPIKVNKSLYLTQFVYFTMLILLGSIISLNFVNSSSVFFVGLYFGILNSILWIVSFDLTGQQFRREEKKLLRALK